MYSKNPYTKKNIKNYIEHDQNKVTNIINGSEKSFLKWKNIPLKQRIKVITIIKKNLTSKKTESARMITLEMGKPIKESIAEIDKCVWVCDYYIDNAEQFLKPEIIKTEAKKSYISFEPLGVILGIMPWNFPFWQVFRFAIPAILSGNTTIVKHASNVSGCSLIIENIFSKNINYKIFYSLLLSSSKMEKIIRNPIIKAISLTGSDKAGRDVGSIAGSQIKKILLELGGADAFIVCKDADINEASKKAVFARMLNNGQSCIAAKRFIIHKNIKKEFIRNIIDILDDMNLGNPNNNKTQIGPLARKDILEDLQTQVNDAINKGATLCYQMKNIPNKGYFFAPTIIDNINADMNIYHNETFGPLFTIIPYSTESEAIKIANDTNYGLGGSIWSSDTENAEKMGHKIYTGAIFINEITKSDPRLPFGGVGISGFGRELGSYGIKEFVNIKTIYIN
jgi:succinate-semialdehyde dehydrogenase / glutarate-semialdehyde dehydrogenase